MENLTYQINYPQRLQLNELLYYTVRVVIWKWNCGAAHWSLHFHQIIYFLDLSTSNTRDPRQNWN